MLLRCNWTKNVHTFSVDIPLLVFRSNYILKEQIIISLSALQNLQLYRSYIKKDNTGFYLSNLDSRSKSSTFKTRSILLSAPMFDRVVVYTLN